jgi:uncharacterized membrane protein
MNIKENRVMTTEQHVSRYSITSAIFNVLDPIPFGLFVAVLIFDIIYAKTGYILWMKGAAWLVTFGLLFAIIPQLINLALVWFSKRRLRSSHQVINFWLNVVAIVAALINAFVHSRDAYAVMPTGLWLSIVTVLAMAVGRIILVGDRVVYKELSHVQA